MRGTRALIHVNHFKHNLATIRSFCAPTTKICLSVKANAYGHGAIPLSRIAIDEGINALGVATTQEALSLRSHGIEAPILLYGIAPLDDLTTLIFHHIELFCTDKEYIDAIAAAAQLVGNKVRVHLKCDTGMGRIGCPPEDALSLAQHLSHLSQWIEIAGVCTHFPLADGVDNEAAHAFTVNQIGEFNTVVHNIRRAGINPGLIHAANSSGLSAFASAQFDMVRPGIMAYGYAPSRVNVPQINVKPVMELRTTVSFIKKVRQGTPLSYGHRYSASCDSWIGTVSIGYADGLHRALSQQFCFVAAQGNTFTGDSFLRFPQVGTICMDQCLVDLGNASAPPAVERWGELVVFGPQPGAENADTLARAANTIPYEILCSISDRIDRELI